MLLYLSYIYYFRVFHLPRIVIREIQQNIKSTEGSILWER